MFHDFYRKKMPVTVTNITFWWDTILISMVNSITQIEKNILYENERSRLDQNIVEYLRFIE